MIYRLTSGALSIDADIIVVGSVDLGVNNSHLISHMILSELGFMTIPIGFFFVELTSLLQQEVNTDIGVARL